MRLYFAGFGTLKTATGAFQGNIQSRMADVITTPRRVDMDFMVFDVEFHS